MIGDNRQGNIYAHTGLSLGSYCYDQVGFTTWKEHRFKTNTETHINSVVGLDWGSWSRTSMKFLKFLHLISCAKRKFFKMQCANLVVARVKKKRQIVFRHPSVGRRQSLLTP